MTAPARAATRRTASAPATPAKSRPLLWALPRPAQGRPLAPFVVLMLALLAVGLVSLLLLNTWSSQDAFRLHTLQAQQNTLDDDEQALAQQVQAATDPITLATRAQALGLVPAGPPVFVRETTPGHYVVVGTRKTVKGTRMGSLLVIAAKTPPKPPAAVVTTAPAVTATTAPASAAASAAAPASAVAPATTTSTAPVVATSTVPVAKTPASTAVKAATTTITKTTVTKTTLTPSTGAVHG